MDWILDPHGKNIMYSYGDANLRLPRPQGSRIGMMNGAAVSMTSKKHTRTSPATSSAELKTAFDTSTDMLGLRKTYYQSLEMRRSSLLSHIRTILQLFRSPIIGDLLEKHRELWIWRLLRFAIGSRTIKSRHSSVQRST
jgi:hypothetical protein